jgi:hypothetical protein
MSKEEVGMPDKVSAQIREIRRNVAALAGVKVEQKVMEDSEAINASSPVKSVALWAQSAMERLDSLTDRSTREKIMLLCGYNCLRANPRPLKSAKARRAKSSSEEAFLEAEVKKPPKGMRFERDGSLLMQFYTPFSYGAGMRCYCSLMRDLPAGQTASRTFCQCSRGFVEKYWEGILGRSVRVDLLASTISGAKECKFAIHL